MARTTTRPEAAEGPETTSGAPEVPPPASEAEELDQVYSTRWYWITFIASLGCLVLALLYYDAGLPPVFLFLYWAVLVVAAVLTFVALVALLLRYRLIHRLRTETRRLAAGSALAVSSVRTTALRQQLARSARGAGGGVFGTVARVGHGVVRFVRRLARWGAALFKAVYRLVLRIVYLVEVTLVWVIILTYDTVYGVLYAAWWLVFHSARIAWKVLYFLLRVVWRILRLPLRLPVARTLWAQKIRPPILAKWRSFLEGRRAKWNAWLERKKRLAAAKGHDPEVWHREKRARHWFLLPQPHVAKDALKRRLAHAAQTKDRRVARGHPFGTPEERQARRAARAQAKEEKLKAKEEAEQEQEQAKEEARRQQREKKKGGKGKKRDEGDRTGKAPSGPGRKGGKAKAAQPPADEGR